jgi:NTP pyrophosphatase (non-canonical NTP hydrolase)
MNFDDYQVNAYKTALYPRDLYLVQGLVLPGILSATITEGSHWLKEQVSKGDITIRHLPWLYPALKLSGEVGEIAEKLGKIIRDNLGEVTEEKRQLIRKELGDILWYVAGLCTEFGFSMDVVAQENLDKLKDRAERGVIHGDGDTR